MSSMKGGMNESEGGMEGGTIKPFTDKNNIDLQYVEHQSSYSEYIVAKFP